MIDLLSAAWLILFFFFFPLNENDASPLIVMMLYA